MPAELSFAGKPTITGERVLLRPVDPADVAGLAAIDEEALRLTGTQHKASRKKLRRWYATRADHADRLDLSIIDRASGRWAGEVVLNNLDRANRSCGFRILLGTAEFALHELTHGTVTFGPAGRNLPLLPVYVDSGGYLRAKGNFNGPVGPSWWGVRMWKAQP